MEPFHFKSNTKKQIINIVLITSIFVVMLYLLFEIIYNYGSEDFPRRLMMINKDLLISGVLFTLIVLGFTIIVAVFFMIKYIRKPLCSVNQYGITYYNSPIYQSVVYSVNWEHIQKIAIIKGKGQFSETFIGINLCNIQQYKTKIDEVQRKHIETTSSLYNYHIAIIIKGFIGGLDGKTDDIYKIIVEYWNVWKAENANKTE